MAPPAPVPAWFLDWAESRIGRRFDAKSAARAVPFTEQHRQQESLASRTGTDFYTRIAQWVQADPANRMLSPHATLMVPEYVRRRIEENTLSSLREAVQISPTNSLAWARLALMEMGQDPKQKPGRLVEAEFSARHAIRLNLLKGCEDELRRFEATHPGDLVLSMRFAALDAWFGREKELAATCSRILEFAKNTKDATTAERAAKICSLRPSDERTREAALGLARRAVELGKTHGFLPYFQMALGVAEYRSGHWALAEQALAAAGESGQGNPHVEGPAAFYRALSLLRQGKPAEARQLAAGAVAKMKPLPRDEKYPLAGDVSADDLIVWLAHKEAMEVLDGNGIAIPAPRITP